LLDYFFISHIVKIFSSVTEIVLRRRGHGRGYRHLMTELLMLIFHVSHIVNLFILLV
jgi:hypothetical protein